LRLFDEVSMKYMQIYSNKLLVLSTQQTLATKLVLKQLFFQTFRSQICGPPQWQVYKHFGHRSVTETFGKKSCFWTPRFAASVC